MSLAKHQSENYLQFAEEKMDIVLKFSLLVEAYFKKEDAVVSIMRHYINFTRHSVIYSPR